MKRWYMLTVVGADRLGTVSQSAGPFPSLNVRAVANLRIPSPSP